MKTGHGIYAFHTSSETRNSDEIQNRRQLKIRVSERILIFFPHQMAYSLKIMRRLLRRGAGGSMSRKGPQQSINHRSEIPVHRYKVITSAMKTGHGIYAFHTSSDITELGIPMKEPRNTKQHYIPNGFSQ